MFSNTDIFQRWLDSAVKPVQKTSCIQYTPHLPYKCVSWEVKVSYNGHDSDKKYLAFGPAIPIQSCSRSVHFHVHFTFHTSPVVWNVKWTWKCALSLTCSTLVSDILAERTEWSSQQLVGVFHPVYTGPLTSCPRHPHLPDWRHHRPVFLSGHPANHIPIKLNLCDLFCSTPALLLVYHKGLCHQQQKGAFPISKDRQADRWMDEQNESSMPFYLWCVWTGGWGGGGA